MRAITRPIVAFAVLLLALACNRPDDPGAGNEVILGEWEKVEKSMPPVNLVITRHSDGDHARLRLSGVEQFGTVTTTGKHIVLHFANAADIAGEIVSATEMTLDLPLPARTSLRRR